MAMENVDAADAAQTKPTRARNRRGEGGRLRGEIISAAVELLDEAKDERAVTLRSVARRAGIAAPSIYPHFPDQPAIMFAVVQQEFVALEVGLRAALGEAGIDPRTRLRTVCDTYLEFALTYPERYRTMFGGLWIPDLVTSSLTEHDLATLGDAVMEILIDALRECVDAGHAVSDDVPADAVALWVGLHGLAHQRAVSPSFPWPADIVDRLIRSLAHITG
jgi:AcrR family transcriptional regulator